LRFVRREDGAIFRRGNDAQALPLRRVEARVAQRRKERRRIGGDDRKHPVGMRLHIRAGTWHCVRE
jgi:hypothetical protein